jgi:precorrin-6A synthase
MVGEHVDFEYDVIPGITAIQALTARHRIPLNDIGEPVQITTGRQLREHGLSGAAVVMLDGECSFRTCAPQTRIWWGAYLGTPDELLASGTVGEIGSTIVDVRAEARARHGWIMDTYLLRPAD